MQSIARNSGNRRRPGSGHPLEIFAFFRRFRQSAARDILYTFIFNSSLAVLFSVMAFIYAPDLKVGKWLWTSWVISNCIGYLIHAGLFIGERILGRWLERQGFWGNTLFYSLIPMAGVFLGYLLGFTLLDIDAGKFLFNFQNAVTIILISLTISGILGFVFHAREKEALAKADLEREHARMESIEKQVVTSNLRLLQAQIEPHFLFNTLANVVSLIDPAPAKAKQMLEDFIDYLRASLSVTRAERLTLRKEIDLIQAYLRLIELRMGERLHYAFDIPESVLDLPFPPMLLQPIVENAIKHGLEPKIEGGRVTIAAHLEDDRLQISVTDNGLGVRLPMREGIGLANVRERLRTLYGERAEFRIGDHFPGTQVTISIIREALSA